MDPMELFGPAGVTGHETDMINAASETKSPAAKRTPSGRRRARSRQRVLVSMEDRSNPFEVIKGKGRHVIHGRPEDIHGTVLDRMIEGLQKREPDLSWDEAYNKIVGDGDFDALHDKDIARFTDQKTGKVFTRQELSEAMGKPGKIGESLTTRAQLGELDLIPEERIQQTRRGDAHSAQLDMAQGEPTPDQLRRQRRNTLRANQQLKKQMREADSPERKAQLTRRRGVLRNLATRKGLLSVAPGALDILVNLVTLPETAESWKAIDAEGGSKRAKQMKFAEDFFGIPPGLLGREKTKAEQDAEWKI